MQIIKYYPNYMVDRNENIYSLNYNHTRKQKKIKQHTTNRGYRYDELAKMFNISRQTIGDIIKRRSWKHI